jgi:anaerobic ribonucleoside-triphosphate reductase activating protein
VQGCSKQCKGCFAEDTWDTDAGFLKDTEEIIRDARSTTGIEGITFLGGEPFRQAKELSIIGRSLKTDGLTVVTFTGHTLEELQESNDKDYNALLEVTDLLIDGEFQAEKQSFDRPWVGSSNQRYRFLTNHYSVNDIMNIRNKVEVRIHPNGKAIISGMGDFLQIQEDFM